MTATAEPQTIIAGDTAQWEISVADYPATDGWTLVYTLINKTSKITFNATAQGADYLVNLLPSTTAGYGAGAYSFQAAVEKTGARHTVRTGDITIKPSFAGQTTYDARSHARKVLDAIEAVIENRATKDQAEYAIGDRSLKRIPHADLYKLRSQYKALVAQEEMLDNRESGRPSRRRSLIRMP